MKNRLMTAVALALLGGGLLAGSSALPQRATPEPLLDKVTSIADGARVP